jgi:PD-(D/E)XK nuclease superfamily
VEKAVPVLNQEGFYRFTDNDPLPALYDESLKVAAEYQQRWKHLPQAMLTEFHVNEPWRGFTLDVYIDAVESLVDASTGEFLGFGIVDYKTYKQPPPEMKDWRQNVMYFAALLAVLERGAIQLPPAPLYVGVDYVRWTNTWKDEDGTPFPSRRFWEVGPDDLDRLEQELRSYQRAVEAEIFLPADKNRNAIFCDYPDNCCLKTTTAAGGSMRRVEVEL